jgi:hypothetical protein
MYKRASHTSSAFPTEIRFHVTALFSIRPPISTDAFFLAYIFGQESFFCINDRLGELGSRRQI